MDRIRVGVVGTGFSGSSHLRALRQLPQVEVVAVAGHSIDKARQAAEIHGVPKSYGDHLSLLRESGAQAIHNCTPNRAHAEVTVAALEAGMHVLSEKPLGMDGDETHSLASAAAAAGVVNAACFNYRYYPLVGHIKAAVESGKVGRPHLIHGSYLQDWLLLDTDWNWRLESRLGGASRAFADIGSHWVDLAQYVTGDLVEEVVAYLGTLHPQRQRPSDAGQALDVDAHAQRQPVRVDTEDYACVMFRFASGCHGTLTVSQVSPGRKNSLALEVDTSSAGFSWNQENPNELWVGYRGEANQLVLRDPSSSDAAQSGLARLPAGHPEGWLDTLVNLFSDFYGAVVAKERGEPYSASFATFADAHRIECIVEAVMASSRLGRPVKVAVETVED